MNAGLRRNIRQAVDSIAPLGWAVIGLAAVTAVAAGRLGWDELEIIAASAIALLGLAALFSIGRLELAPEISVTPTRVVVGERASGRLSVRNRRNRAVRSIRIELPVGGAVAAYSVGKLAAQESMEELFVVPTQRRAVLPVGPITSVQGDPLGLFRRTRTWGIQEEIFIHPRTVAVGALASGLIRDMEGQPTNELSPSDIAFHALREYVPGDDRRHIHWKSTAKIGKFMVRQYVDTRRSHVAVALSVDLSDYADEDEFELGVSCAASIALQALREGQTLSVFVGAEQLPTVNSRALLDRFSAIEIRPSLSIGARTDRDAAAAILKLRSQAAEASVAVVCAGSGASPEQLRRATAWLPTEMASTVLRAAHGEESGFYRVGTTQVVNIPDLESLPIGLRASMAAA